MCIIEHVSESTQNESESESTDVLLWIWQIFTHWWCYLLFQCDRVYDEIVVLCFTKNDVNVCYIAYKINIIYASFKLTQIKKVTR